MEFGQKIEESLDMAQGSVTKSFAFILGTGFFFTVMLGIEVLPGLFAAGIAAGFLITWLGYPIALHYDRKFVKQNSDWRPSRWYYLGFLPGYLGLVFVLYYCYRRKDEFEAPVE